MITNKILRDQVRERAQYACEYCGIKETDVGGLLTIDHFQPQSKGGSDHPDNLIYCCHSCNSFKHDYFPERESDPRIWNPRSNSRSQHFFEINDGRLTGLTSVGKATIFLLRLNRLPLVDYRRNQKIRQEEVHLLKHYQHLVSMLQQINQELAILAENQQELLEQQQQLLRFLLDEEEKKSS